MSTQTGSTYSDIRQAMAGFQLSPSVQPNASIGIENVFFPSGHRNVLDLNRQLVVGNRGVGKSFWTHALTNQAVKSRLASTYSFPNLATAEIIIGFNASARHDALIPSLDEIQSAYKAKDDPLLIWRAVILRASRSLTGGEPQKLNLVIEELKKDTSLYAEELTRADDELALQNKSLLVVFDALDRLAHDWETIRELTKGLLRTVLDLKSFQNIRAKVFMRVDQFADSELFQFADSSKIRNDHVNLRWETHELYGLVFFELMKDQAAKISVSRLADQLGVRAVLPSDGRVSQVQPEEQANLVSAIAGEFMGSNKKRGKVYTWVPLHLSDAAENCSPRTFITAWKAAAEHHPPANDRAVDHLGLNDGVRKASQARVTELSEEYDWIAIAFEPLRRQFVPIAKKDLFQLWDNEKVVEEIVQQAAVKKWLAPIGMFSEQNNEALLKTMTSIAVMEERGNGKINVPDIFRVEAGILRKGGVAVPRKK